MLRKVLLSAHLMTLSGLPYAAMRWCSDAKCSWAPGQVSLQLGACPDTGMNKTKDICKCRTSIKVVENVFQIRYILLLDIWDMYSLRTIRTNKSNIPKTKTTNLPPQVRSLKLCMLFGQNHYKNILISSSISRIIEVVIYWDLKNISLKILEHTLIIC